jgi:hypothetical protein
MDAGPGVVRILQLGPKGDPAGALPAPPGSAAARPRPAAQPAEEEYKLTWVRYDGSMRVYNQTRTVKFFQNIDVLHMPLPTENPGLDFNMDKLINKLPAGALHLHSDRLTVYSPKDSQGRTHQEMSAEGKAITQWQDEFYGTADVITFNEEKQQVALQGSQGNPALVELLRPGANGAPSHFRALKLIYNRLTDQWSVTNGYSSGN